MERELTFNSKILDRINLLFADIFDPRSRHTVHYSVPGNVDLSQVSLSFGQYKGQLVNKIWKLDKNYIKKLSREKWLADYPVEGMAVHTLLENQRLFKS